MKEFFGDGRWLYNRRAWGKYALGAAIGLIIGAWIREIIIVIYLICTTNAIK